MDLSSISVVFITNTQRRKSTEAEKGNVSRFALRVSLRAFVSRFVSRFALSFRTSRFVELSFRVSLHFVALRRAFVSRFFSLWVWQ